MMSLHRVIQHSLVAAMVFSVAGVASAHVFPTPQTKSERALERAAECERARTLPVTARPNPFVRFGRPPRIEPTTIVKVDVQRDAGFRRFGSGDRVSEVVCRQTNIASRSH
jgi:hypothetical protein